MKQLNFTILLTVLMSMIGVTAFAHDIAVKNAKGVTIYYNYHNKYPNYAELSVTYSGSSRYSKDYTGNVVIPKSVTRNNTTHSVTEIGVSAFYGCSGLTSVTIPNSVMTIGGDAFYGCSGLTSITIPNSVTKIGMNAFYGCSGLTSVTIPNSVTSIYGSSPFKYCPGLISMKVESGNTKYDSRGNCNAIIATASNTLIAGCKNTTIPNGVTSIGYGAFEGCSDLASIVIPNSVTDIGVAAFYDCSGLTSVTIPNSVTSIGGSAFWGCSGLTSITIPNSVTSIGKSPFAGCSKVNTFIVESGNTKYDSRYGSNAIIETASNTLIAGCNNTTIPNNVTSIGYCAFYNCSGLTSVTIPNSVTNIGERAFSGCSGLTSVTIPNSVTEIGMDAFSGCSGLTSVTIPNSVTNISDYAFSGCSALTSVIIPNSVKSIGRVAFQNCKALTSVIIPNSVKSIGEYAFNICSSLKNVYNEATTPQALSSDPLFYYTKVTLHVPAGTKELYQAADYWKNFSNIVEDINTVTVEDDKEPATTVEGEEFYNLVLDKETVEFAEIISANEAGKVRIAIKDGGLLIVKGDDVRFALSEIKKSDILVFDFVGKIRCLYGTLTANTEQQNTFPQVTSDEMELESGKEYIANEDCDVVLEMETTESPVELKSITITEPTGVSIVETSTSNPSSGKTYNLSGQQVNANSNGLLIQDGKKIIKQ